MTDTSTSNSTGQGADVSAEASVAAGRTEYRFYSSIRPRRPYYEIHTQRVNRDAFDESRIVRIELTDYELYTMERMKENGDSDNELSERARELYTPKLDGYIRRHYEREGTAIPVVLAEQQDSSDEHGITDQHDLGDVPDSTQADGSSTKSPSYSRLRSALSKGRQQLGGASKRA